MLWLRSGRPRRTYGAVDDHLPEPALCFFALGALFKAARARAVDDIVGCRAFEPTRGFFKLARVLAALTAAASDPVSLPEFLFPDAFLPAWHDPGPPDGSRLRGIRPIGLYSLNSFSVVKMDDVFLLNSPTGSSERTFLDGEFGMAC